MPFTSINAVRRTRFVVASFLLSLALTGGLARVACGATITVTNAGTSGAGSLEQAITTANGTPADDTIVFDSALFGSPQTITLPAEQLPLVAGGALTITGPGAHLLRLTRGGGSRLFQVNGTAPSFTMSGVTITGGANAAAGGGAFFFNSNTGPSILSFSNCIFTGNSSGINGGALSVAGLNTTFTMTNCHFINNSATSSGGALFMNGSIANVMNATITNTSFIDNTATGNSGGGVQVSSGAAVTFRNCTFSGNSAPSNAAGNGMGGALRMLGGSTIAFVNCTVTGNSSGGLCGGIVGSTNATMPNAISLRNTLVAGNTGPTAPDINIGIGNITAFTTTGGNLIGDNTGAPAAFSTSGSPNASSDYVGTAGTPILPRLSPAGNHGGIAWTRAVLSGSTAIDNGVTAPSTGLTTDARGAARIAGPREDVGAYERSASPGDFTAILPSGKVGDPYSTTLASGATGITYTVSSGSLPASLTLANTAGNVTISGTPTSGGTSTFQITESNGANSVVVQYQIVITSTFTAPVVTTPTQTGVTINSATLGGNVTSDGGATITARGVVYSVTSTNNNPQIGGGGVVNATVAGTTGVFTQTVSSLASSTGYSFAAYATNSEGTTYTTVGTFMTLTPPTITATLAATPASVSPGGTISYTAKITNIDTVTKTGVAFNLTLDNNTTLVPNTLNSSPYTIDQPSVSALVGIPKALTFSAVDPDAATVLTYAITQNPTLGTVTGFNAATGALTYTGTTAGTDTIKFRATDNFSTPTASNEDGVVTLNVTFSPPVAAADSYQVARNQTLNQAAPGVLSNDTVNSSTIASYGASTGAEQTTIGSPTATTQAGTISLNANGGFSYVPATNFAGSDTFKYVLSNGGGNSMATVTINVIAPPLAVNDPSSGVLATPVNQMFGRNPPGVLGNDTLNGATITGYGATTGIEQTTIGNSTPTAQGGSVLLNANGSYTFTPLNGFSGNDTFKYTLTNISGSSTATVTIYVDVLPTVTSTVPTNGATSVNINGAITINFSEQVTFQGAFSISPSVTLNQSPADLTPTNTVTLTPATPLAPGVQYTLTMDRFQVADTDGGLSPAANLSLVFTTLPLPVAVNDGGNNPEPPIAVTSNIPINTLGQTATPFNILGNDALNGGTLTTFGATGPTSNVVVNGVNTATTQQGGTILLRTDGTYMYTPPPGYSSLTQDAFFYKLTNTSGTVQAQVRFLVSGTVVWFADAAAAGGGNGTLARPFNTLAGAETASQIGQTIFMVAGNYTGGITLKNTVRLFGQAMTGTNFDTNVLGAAAAPFSIARPAINGTAPVITTAVAATNGVTLGSGNTLNGFNFGNCTGVALVGSNFGTLTVNTVAINSTGRALSLTTGGFAAGAAFTSITASSVGLGEAIVLSSCTGSVNFGTGTLTGGSGGIMSIAGGTVSAIYSGNINQTSNVYTVSVSGHSTGTITFQTGTINATNGNGVEFTNADGTYNFNGTTTFNGGDAGVDILAGSGGTFNFGTGTSITNPSSIGLRIDTSTPTVNYNGTISKNNAGLVVGINAQTGGSTGFGGLITASGTAGGISLTGNGTTPIVFSGELQLSTGTNTAFTATGGGTVTVSNAFSALSTTTGQILNWDGVSIGGGGVTFASLQSTGVVAADAISLNNVDGAGSLIGGNVTIAGTSGAGSDGIAITGDSAATLFTFTSATIDNTVGHGIFLSGANGLVTFTTVNIDGCSGSGIAVSGNINPVNVNGGTVGATNDPAANAVDIDQGSATVIIAAALTKNTAGRIVEVTGRTGGTVNISGSLSCSGSSTGINAANNTGGTIRFTNITKSLSTGTQAAVTLTTNPGATIEFQNGGLGITTTSGNGFNATGGGTVTVQGTGNTITSTTGTALNVANTTIGASHMTFQSIGSNGGTATGIILDTTGSSGGLRVTGSPIGNATVGSGGTIANKTGADGATTTGNGIYLNSTIDVRLAGMQLNDFQNSAIRGFAVAGFKFEDSVINGAVGNNSGSIEGAIAFGDVLAVGTAGLSGACLIDQVNVSGSIEHHLEFYNQTGTLNLTITNSNIHDNTVASGSDGIQMEFRGNAQVFTLIDGNQFSNNKSQAIQFGVLEDANVHATISSNTVTRGTQGNEGIVLSNGGNSRLTTLIGGPTLPDGNTVSGFGGVAIFVGQVGGQGSATSLLQATIQSNTVTSPASATNHAILAFVSSLTGQVSQAIFLIDKNTVTYGSAAARAILVDAPDTGRTPEFRATVTNNIVTATDVNAVTMISVAARNNAIGHSDIRGNDVNYTTAVGISGINVREATLGSNVLARGGSASNDSSVVLAANNALSTTTVIPSAVDIPVVENNTILQPAAPTLPTLPL